MHMQVLTAPTSSPVQPTGPIASMSETCSHCWPDTAATATTQTVTAPTAAAGPTPTQKHSDKFFFFFSFSSQPDRTMAATSLPSSAPPSPACRPSRLCTILPKPQLAAATTLSPPQPWPLQLPLFQLSSPQSPPPPPQSSCPNCHCPNCHCHPNSITATAPTVPLPPVSPGPHLQHHPSYTSTRSMYLFKSQIYFLCMNVTNLV